MVNKVRNIKVYDQDTCTEEKSVVYRLLGKSIKFNLDFIEAADDAIVDSKDSDIFLFKLKNFETFNSDKLNKIRDYCELNKIPLVLIYKFHDINQYIHSFELGFNFFISLPTNAKFFEQKIDEILMYYYSKDKMPTNDMEKLKYLAYLSKLDENKVTGDLVFSLLNNNFYSGKLIASLKEFILKNHRKNKIQDKENHTRVDGFSYKEQRPGLLKELRKGLENDEYRLYYQPIIDVSTNDLVGFESLIRWEHPEQGIIAPDDFIPTIENSDLIVPLGFWIVEEAARQLHQWNQKLNLKNSIKIDVNLSVKQFLHKNLAEEIFDIVGKYDVANECIAFELTESAFMEDMSRANITLLKLKSKNFPIYMDDFGTGYSSLTYLMHFPMDVLKIDKSFVEFMNIDEQSEEIVRSIVAMAHNLKMKVIAEGIENEEHWDMLKDLECDYSQGYYHSKPLRAEEAEEFIKRFR